jgi:hypothetical protein
VNTRLPLNETYRAFYDLVASAAPSAVVTARAYEALRQSIRSMSHRLEKVRKSLDTNAHLVHPKQLRETSRFHADGLLGGRLARAL